MFKRECPNCKKIIIYHKKSSYDIANKCALLCKECEENKLQKYGYKYIKKCSKCGKTVEYKNTTSYINAIEKHSVCLKCALIIYNDKDKKYIRKCPKCNREIKYANENTYIQAEKTKKLCPSCIVKKSNMEEKKYVRHCPNCGDDIYYKKEKGMLFAESKKTLCYKCRNNITNNNKKGIPSKLKGKPHISFYDSWVKKYGKDIADKKMETFKINCSTRFKGEGNPMYGKIPAKESGRGWSGYYKNNHFRSLLELYYLIYLIDNNIKFESCERKKYAIQYTMDIDNVTRNYFMDYHLLDTDEFIEIKPKKLLYTAQNKSKFKAAKNLLGNKFKIITDDNIDIIDINFLYSEYKNGNLIFDKRYISKFEDFYKKHK